ncbi:MAG: type II secretion system protein, partial [Oscillospiraceae bacterium]|nr:type II secretion system protein [Oscillospiraceae bacterium]
MKNIKQKLGFTLVELMIVVAILGALTAAGVPAFNKSMEISEKRTCANTLTSVQAGMKLAIDNGGSYQKEATVTSANGDLAKYIKNIDEMRCPTSGELYMITNDNRAYCPEHQIHSGMVKAPINLSSSSAGNNSGNNGGNTTEPESPVEPEPTPEPEPEPEPETPVHTHTYASTNDTIHTCSGCKETENHTIKTTTVDATCGHTGTITDTCDVCGYEKITITPSTGQHTWVTGLYNDGSIGCSVCKHRQEGGYSVTAETPATCTTAGSRTYTCNWDGCVPRHIYTEEIPALGHDYSIVQSITYPYYLRTTALTKTG